MTETSLGPALTLAHIQAARVDLEMAAEDFDTGGEVERAMAVRRAIRNLDEATEGLR